MSNEQKFSIQYSSFITHRLFKGTRILKRAVSDLLYPPECLHCQGAVSDSSISICSECLPLLELIEPSERCLICFSIKLTEEKPLCHKCQGQTSIFNGLGAAFDYAGPAATLVRRLKYSSQSYLVKGMSAYLVTQLLRFNWPTPDILIPAPMTFAHQIQRGYNQSELLAVEMGKLLNRPVVDLLRREGGDYSQAGLTKKQRMELKGDRFQLIEGEVSLQDKTVLLIDDVMTTGTTLKHCGQVLLSNCPSGVYALTFCKALE